MVTANMLNGIILIICVVGSIYLACGTELNCRLGDSFVKWSVDGQCYKFIDTTVLFSQANSTCQSYGGYPTSVKSVEQENFLFTMMSTEAVGTIWIGLYQGSDGQYYWYEDNSLKGSYGEAPSGQFCFTGISRSTSGTNWFFKNCNSQTTAKIICVMPPTCPQDSSAPECVAPTTSAPETTTAEENMLSLSTTNHNGHTSSNQPAESAFSELFTSTMESPTSTHDVKTFADEGTTEMIAKATTFEPFYTESTARDITAITLMNIWFSTTTLELSSASMATAPAVNEYASSSTSSHDVESASAITDSNTSPILSSLDDDTSTAADLFTTTNHEMSQTSAVDDSTAQNGSTKSSFKPGSETTSTTDSSSTPTNTDSSTTSIDKGTNQPDTTGEDLSTAESMELITTVRTEPVSTSVESTSQADGTQQPASTDSESTSTTESLGLSAVVSSTHSVDMISQQTEHTSASSTVIPPTSRTKETKVTSMDSATSSNDAAITTVKIESVTMLETATTQVLQGKPAEKQSADVLKAKVGAGSAVAALVGAAATVGLAAFILRKKKKQRVDQLHDLEEDNEALYEELPNSRPRNTDSYARRAGVIKPADMPEPLGMTSTDTAVRSIQVAPAGTGAGLSEFANAVNVVRVTQAMRKPRLSLLPNCS